MDGALREAAASLEELRGQDEPVFTAMAAFTAGSLEMALGRYDDALRHLREARDLAERSGGDWLAAGSRVQLGILAVLRGRLDEARALLDEALDLSLAARSTPFVTLCLAAYARLAFAEGDPERAALLEGAAEGLRQRVGLRAWPHLRQVEAELVAQVRQGLGAGRFDQAFSAGSGLTQREAVAVVRDQRGTRHPDVLSRYRNSAKPQLGPRLWHWRFRLASCWPIQIGSFGVSAETWQSNEKSAHRSADLARWPRLAMVTQRDWCS